MLLGDPVDLLKIIDSELIRYYNLNLLGNIGKQKVPPLHLLADHRPFLLELLLPS